MAVRLGQSMNTVLSSLYDWGTLYRSKRGCEIRWILGKEIYDCAIRCGFDNCGIISIDEMDGFNELYQNRIDNVPQSKYFYDGVGNLRGTKSRFPWAQSIVILAYNYGKHFYPKELQGKYAKAFFLEPEKNSYLLNHKAYACAY